MSVGCLSMQCRALGTPQGSREIVSGAFSLLSHAAMNLYSEVINPEVSGSHGCEQRPWPKDPCQGSREMEVQPWRWMQGLAGGALLFAA